MSRAMPIYMTRSFSIVASTVEDNIGVCKKKSIPNFFWMELETVKNSLCGGQYIDTPSDESFLVSISVGFCLNNPHNIVVLFVVL